MRKVPVKNYILLAFLVVATVALTYYCCKFYTEHYRNSYLTVMLPFITEIKEDDIENYVLENPTVVLYISDKLDSSLEEEEVEIKNVLTEQNIHQYFVYLDISNDKENSLKSFQEDYHITLNYEKLPILVAFSDGQVTEIYNEESFSINDITSFLIRNGVIDEND